MNDSATEERPTRPSPRARVDSSKRRMLAGREARQGDIILNTPARRAWFIGGLVACVVLLLVIALVK